MIAMKWYANSNTLLKISIITCNFRLVAPINRVSMFSKLLPFSHILDSPLQPIIIPNSLSHNLAVSSSVFLEGVPLSPSWFYPHKWMEEWLRNYCNWNKCQNNESCITNLACILASDNTLATSLMDVWEAKVLYSSGHVLGGPMRWAMQSPLLCCLDNCFVEMLCRRRYAGVEAHLRQAVALIDLTQRSDLWENIGEFDMRELDDYKMQSDQGNSIFWFCDTIILIYYPTHWDAIEKKMGENYSTVYLWDSLEELVSSPLCEFIWEWVMALKWSTMHEVVGHLPHRAVVVTLKQNQNKHEP